jgi:hypothetical protein
LIIQTVTAINTLIDASGNSNTGTLNNFVNREPFRTGVVQGVPTGISCGAFAGTLSQLFLHNNVAGATVSTSCNRYKLTMVC